MSESINTASVGQYRVRQTGTGFERHLGDYASPEMAYLVARFQNQAIGIDEVSRVPALVFTAEGSLLYGPAELCGEMYTV